MRLTKDNASVHFAHLVRSLTGADFTEGKVAVIGDTRLVHSIEREDGTRIDYAFTLVITEVPSSDGSEPTLEAVVLADRFTFVAWQGMNRSNIAQWSQSTKAALDADKLSLQIEECIDGLTAQADALRNAIQNGALYV